MKTTRDDFIAHLEASGLFSTVKPLGDRSDLEESSVALPAAFVVYAGGKKKRKESATLHLFIPGFSAIGDDIDAADDALGLTEQVVDYLHANWNWIADDRTYQVPRDQEGLDTRAGRIRDQHSFYVITVPVNRI